MNHTKIWIENAKEWLETYKENYPEENNYSENGRLYYEKLELNHDGEIYYLCQMFDNDDNEEICGGKISDTIKEFLEMGIEKIEKVINEIHYYNTHEVE